MVKPLDPSLYHLFRFEMEPFNLSHRDEVQMPLCW